MAAYGSVLGVFGLGDEPARCWVFFLRLIFFLNDTKLGLLAGAALCRQGISIFSWRVLARYGKCALSGQKESKV